MTVPGATLATIDAAIYTAVSALQCPVNGIVADAQPFALVARHAGEVNRDTLQGYGAQFPLALVAFDAESSARILGTVIGEADDRALGEWVVYVAVEEPRDTDSAVQGTAGVPGALMLIGQVIGVANQLTVAGLWNSRRVRYVGTRAHLVIPGALYCYAVRFEAMRDAEFVELTAETIGAVDMTDVRGSVNLLDQPDDATNPVVVFDADTTT